MVPSGDDGRQWHPKCACLCPVYSVISCFAKIGYWKWKQAFQCFYGSLRIFCLDFNPKHMESSSCLIHTSQATAIWDLKQSCEWRGAAVNADEALLACPLLTSCYVAWFLTGQGPVSVCGPRTGDSCSSSLRPAIRWAWEQSFPGQVIRWDCSPSQHLDSSL